MKDFKNSDIKYIISGIGHGIGELNRDKVDIDDLILDYDYETKDNIIPVLCYILIIIFLSTTLFGTFLPFIAHAIGIKFSEEYVVYTSNFFVAMLFGEILSMILCILVVAIYKSFYDLDTYSSTYSSKTFSENEKKKLKNS